MQRLASRRYGATMAPVGHAGMQREHGRLLVASGLFDAGGLDQLVERSLGGAVTVPAAQAVVFDAADSGREKLVTFSQKGAIFADRMMANGILFLEGIVEKLNDDEIDMLMHVFRRTSEIFESYPGPFRSAKPVLPPQL